MNIPQGFIELFIAAVVGFVFRVNFGLISKNEAKSDEADSRLEAEIKSLHREMKEVEQRYRNNDRELYSKVESVRVEMANNKAVLDCLRGRVNANT